MSRHSKRIKSTRRQTDALLKCHRGVGFVVYHSGPNTTTEFEFYLDRNNQPRFLRNGQPVTFDLDRTEEDA
jgi:hypothetical protein